MNPKIIKTEKEYEDTLRIVEELVSKNPAANSTEGENLSLYSVLIENYENENFPIELPSPIEAIRFRMEEQNLKQSDLIAAIGSKSKVSEVLSGKRTLTLKMIRSLHQEFGIPLKVLVGDAQLAQPTEVIEEDLNKYPAQEMQKKGWIDLSNSPAVVALKDFFSHAGGYQIAFAHWRKSVVDPTKSESEFYALVAWSAKVRIEADKVGYSKSFDRKSFQEETLRDIARLSFLENGPFLAREYLLQIGIVLVFVDHLPNSRLDGGCFNSKTGNPIIGMTLRNDRIDNYWFTLMHELVHIWKHGIGEDIFFVDNTDDENTQIKKDEVEADRIAGSIFIPSVEWKRSDACVRKTEDAIYATALKYKVHPAIVAGRLRKETKNYRIFSKLVGQGEIRKLFQARS